MRRCYCESTSLASHFQTPTRENFKGIKISFYVWGGKDSPESPESQRPIKHSYFQASKCSVKTHEQQPTQADVISAVRVPDRPPQNASLWAGGERTWTWRTGLRFRRHGGLGGAVGHVGRLWAFRGQVVRRSAPPVG